MISIESRIFLDRNSSMWKKVRRNIEVWLGFPAKSFFSTKISQFFCISFLEKLFSCNFAVICFDNKNKKLRKFCYCMFFFSQNSASFSLPFGKFNENVCKSRKKIFAKLCMFSVAGNPKLSLNKHLSKIFICFYKIHSFNC